MNKFHMMNVVSTSTLNADDKALLNELLLRLDVTTGECWPSVERLCQVRGIKYEKNFKGVEQYLPGLVTKEKRGRKNFYTINEKAVLGLEQFQVIIKHTPSLSGSNIPAVAADTPAVAADGPSVAGANNSIDSTFNSSANSSRSARSASHSEVVPPSSSTLEDKANKDESFAWSSLIDFKKRDPDREGTVDNDTPAVEGELVTVGGRTLTLSGELDW
jgi:hypothetical protein